jgi:hypothetical protein
MKEGVGNDHLAIAWEYPGLDLEVIPATFSLVTHICHLDVNCGAILDTWAGINGTGIIDLIAGTSNFSKEPNDTIRLTHLLEVPTDVYDNYGSRMKGWLVPPVTGEFVFWIASDDNGEFWLSPDSIPKNKGLACYTPEPVSRYNFTAHSEQKSNLIPLIAGRAYYYEVRRSQIFIIFSTLRLPFHYN